MKEFCYLGDLWDNEGSVERSVRMRVTAAWRKWRENSGLFTKKDIPLKYIGRVHDACVRSMLPYGGEGWSIIEKVLATLTSCDRIMKQVLFRHLKK